MIFDDLQKFCTDGVAVAADGDLATVIDLPGGGPVMDGYCMRAVVLDTSGAANSTKLTVSVSYDAGATYVAAGSETIAIPADGTVEYLVPFIVAPGKDAKVKVTVDLTGAITCTAGLVQNVGAKWAR